MKKRRLTRPPVSGANRSIAPTSPPTTLADIIVSWKEGDKTRRATGRQIAHLLTAAAAQSSSDLSFGAEGDRTGQWIYKLRGLSGLLTLEEGDAASVRDNDSKAIIADLLDLAAAELLADQLDSAEWPARFTVQIMRSDTEHAGGAR